MGSGTLYAYELPAPAIILSMSAEDESTVPNTTKESIGLNEIQRGKLASEWDYFIETCPVLRVSCRLYPVSLE